MALAFRHWPRVLMRGGRILGWTLLALFGLVLLALGFILSPTGTSWALDKARTHGYLTYDRVAGAPLDHLVLEGLRMPLGKTELQASRLELRWATDCLLRGRLCIDSVRGQDVHLVLGASDTSQAAEDSGPMARIRTPIPVEVRDLTLDDVSVTMATGMQLSWAHFSSGATLEGSQLTLAPTLLSDAHLVMAPAAAAEPVPLPQAVERAPVQPRASTLSRSSMSPRTAIRNPLAPYSIQPLDLPAARIQLPDHVLPIDVTVPSVQLRHVLIEGQGAPQHIDELDLALHTRGDHVVVDKLRYKGSEGELSAAADVRLSGEYPLAMMLEGTVHHAPLSDEHIALRAAGSLAALRLHLQSGQRVPLDAAVKVDLLSQSLPFSLELTSPQLQWPLSGAKTNAEGAGGGVNRKAEPEASYRIDKLSVRADGDLSGYQLNIEGVVRSNTRAPMPIQITGRGDDHQLIWDSFQVGVGSQGGLSSRGQLQWAPRLTVMTDVTLDRLHLEALVPSLEGVLSGKGHVVFQQGEDAGWTLQVPQLALNGTFMKQPLTLDGQLVGDSTFHWHIPRFNLRQGRNHFQMQGVIADQSDLQATIEAPALSSLWPGLAGRVNGQLDVKGSLTAPRGRVALVGEQLRYGSHRLQRVTLQGSGDGSDDPSMALALDARGVQSGTLALRSALVTLTGRLSQHRLALAIEGQKNSPVTDARLTLDAGWDKQTRRYHARVTPLSVATAQAGRFALSAPLMADIDLQRSAATVAPFCLVRAQGGRLCAEKPIVASVDQGQARFTLSSLPMSLLDPIVPAPWRVSGSTQGRFDLHWSAGAARWSAQGDISNTSLVSGKDAAGNAYALPALAAHLQLEATPDRARLRLQMALQHAGQLSTDIAIIDPLTTRQLAGTVKAEQLLLAPYRPLVPGIDTLEGALNGQVDLSGTLQRPRLDGQLVLAGVKAKGDIMPIALDDARVALNLHGEAGELEGYLASGASRLLLNGNATWPLGAPWQVGLSLRDNGTPLDIAALDYGRVKVSPRIDLNASPTLLSIEGNIDVPWARIEVAQLPPSVQTPSSDEVILTRDEAAQLDRARAGLARQQLSRERHWADAAALQKAGMAINLNVHVAFGRDVHLSAYGLNSYIGGAFDVRQRQNAIQLFGTVTLNDGRYKSFGQDLLIQKGEVTFTGPAALPRLDIVAIRNPDSIEDNVTAGVKVTGTAQSPNVQVFSNPAMNETSALSYLLQGHGSDSGGNDNALTSALIGLSIAQSGSTVGAIGETFGIKDLSLDTAGTGDSSKVVVSGYVMPRLKVSYGVGVFSPIAELTLRYRLLQSVYLQGVSGASQALDLIYIFSLGRTPDTLPNSNTRSDPVRNSAHRD